MGFQNGLTMGMRFPDQAQEKWAGAGFWAPTEAEVKQAIHDAGFAGLQISHFKYETGGPLASLFNWGSRAVFGSDETRLVRAVTAAAGRARDPPAGPPG